MFKIRSDSRPSKNMKQKNFSKWIYPCRTHFHWNDVMTGKNRRVDFGHIFNFDNFTLMWMVGLLGVNGLLSLHHPSKKKVLTSLFHPRTSSNSWKKNFWNKFFVLVINISCVFHRGLNHLLSNLFLNNFFQLELNCGDGGSIQIVSMCGLIEKGDV